MTDQPTICERCGQHHPGCKAHSKAHGGPCGAKKMRDQDICHKHGGAAAQNKAAAKTRGQIAIARAEVTQHGLPTDIDPHTALLDELRRTSGWVLYLEAKVDELDEDDLVWGKTESVKKRSGEFPGTDTTKAAKPNAWYALLTAERKHLLDVASACIKAGIDERRIQLAEDQGRLIAGAIQQILAQLQLTPDQMALVPDVVPVVLRSITAPAALEETR